MSEGRGQSRNEVATERSDACPLPEWLDENGEFLYASLNITCRYGFLAPREVELVLQADASVVQRVCDWLISQRATEVHIEQRSLAFPTIGDPAPRSAISARNSPWELRASITGPGAQTIYAFNVWLCQKWLEKHKTSEAKRAERA